MKKLIHITLVVLLAFCGTASGQLLPPNQPEQDACNALVLCDTVFYTPLSYQGIGQVNDLVSTPCGLGEGNSMWLKLVINTGGTIVFSITPVIATDDYDFAVVNGTSVPCNNLSSSNVIRCNFNNNNPGSNVNGTVGLNATSTQQFVVGGTFGNSFLQQITASPGDIYYIMVNNFGFYSGTGTPGGGFTINFSGSTATFNTTTPGMSSVIPSCNNSQTVTVQMNSIMLCNSIAPNGSDFTVSGGGSIVSATGNCPNPNGYTNQITLNFASPLAPGTYTLGVQNGSDNNTVLNICNIPVPLTDAIQFTISPYVAPSFVSIDTPACRILKVKMATKVRCDSIAKDGSDFALSGPQASPVVAAYGIACDTTNFTDSIVILLQDALVTDGVYTITAKKGTDGNTQMDSCGLIQLPGDAISFTISSYDGRIVSIPDTILCGAQYFQLNSQNYSTPPLSEVACNTTAPACAGNYYVAFTGTKDSSSALNSPFFGGFQDARAQYLYRASELRSMGLNPGSIQTLQWKVTQLLSNVPYSDFTIKIGCTQASDLAGAFLPTSQVVYTTPSYTPTAGWNTFTLSTPYNWDGVSNLVVEVCYDNTTSSSSDFVAHSVTNFSSVLRQYGNNLSGCTITNQGTVQGSNFLRPRLRFYICEPPVGTAAYLWTPATLVSDSTIQNPLAFVNNNVTYHVTTFDKFGCAHRDSNRVTLSIRNPSVTPLDTTICRLEKVPLHATGGSSYAWIAADPSTLSCITCPDPIAIPTQTSVYTVIIGDQYNCKDTLTSRINVNQLPIINVSPEDTIVKYGTRIRLIGTGAYLYNWYPAGYLSDPNVVTPFAIITKPVVFILTGIDENGCRNVDSVRIGVDYSDPMFIPTAFSPNGDGKNDIFKIGSLSFQQLQEFRIFNRWGQEVFTTTNPQQGWDGQWNGVPQDQGVYNYIIRIAYPDGKVDLFKGDITLIR